MLMNIDADENNINSYADDDDGWYVCWGYNNKKIIIK